MKPIRGSKGRAKYRNRKVEYKGDVFASNLELQCWMVLEDMQAKGEIRDLARQVWLSMWVNGRKVCSYVADFVFTWRGRRIVADSKGCPTPEFLLKQKLLKATDDIDIVVWKSVACMIRWFKEN